MLIEWSVVFNAISDMAMILNREHEIPEINPAVLKMTGLDRKDIIGRLCYQVFHCADHPPERCPHQKFFTSIGAQTIDMEMEFLGRTFMVKVAPISNGDGNIHWIIHLAKDITERKNFEHEIQRKNRAQKVLISCNEAVIRAKNENLLVQDLWNILVRDGGYRLAWVGYALEDVGKTVKPMASCGFNDNYVETADIVWSDTKRGQGPVGRAMRIKKHTACRNIQTDPRFEIWRADAISRDYASLIALHLMIDKKCIGALNIYSTEPDAFDTDETGILLEANKAAQNFLGRPVTEIIGMHHSSLHPKEDREKYERLRQSQKMEAIGILACGIAHDFNNILSPIMGYTELAMLEAKGNETVQSDLSRIMEADRRAKELVQQILTFSWKDTAVLSGSGTKKRLKPFLRFILPWS